MIYRQAIYMSEKKRSIFSNESFVDLTLYQYGYEKCEPLHSFGPAVYNHFIFHYILSGQGQLRSTDDKGATNIYHLGAGQGFLIWPRQTNRYTADERNPWVYTWIEFDGLRAKELITYSGMTFNYPVYIAQNDEACQKMSDELLIITRDNGNSSLRLIGHLYLFLDALINSSSAKRKISGGSLREFYAREVLQYIGLHYHESITVEDIAAHCNINRNYLGKIFRSVFDESPQEFLIRYRINKACELLKITDRTIGEIGMTVGYPNQFNFSRTFKKVMGEPPREWRDYNKIR